MPPRAVSYRVTDTDDDPHDPPETFIFIARASEYASDATSTYIHLQRCTYSALGRYAMQYGITAGSLIRDLHIVQDPRMQLNEHNLNDMRGYIRESSRTNGRICLVVVGWSGFTTHARSFETLFNMVFSPRECVRLLVFADGQFYPIYVETVLDYLCGLSMPLSQGDPTTRFTAQFLGSTENASNCRPSSSR
ncbi:uncharacterized protein N7515_006383 [Penicillium bovifimosum]|uniref:Uncharacterized protein n=1 Tax=Penicillium bovifimosum TaxID=126998 RepID=A0A9W9GW46_9EURO|nr:uncharacterized protein N7515_006383 [Penicillium bovifimosum]KAJ5130344.1 hypothetical protein N7515_006383 [Penicillium bovifimosum]